MPHQCVRCGTMYEDGAAELLKGCSKCNGRFFFYMKKTQIEEAKKLIVDLKPEERVAIEKDVYDIVGGGLDKDKPVILDLETIRLMKPGQYELDLVNLFRGKPLIYKLEEGKYIIDIASSFKKKGEKEDFEDSKEEFKEEE